MRVSPLLASCLLLPACAAGPTAPEAPDEPARLVVPPRGTAPLTNDAAVVIYHAGAEALFADPRDAGLRRAFAGLDDRLIELAEEDAEAVQALEMLGAVGAGPTAIEFHVVPGPALLRGQVTLFTDDAASPGTSAMREAQVRRLLRAFGAEGLQTPAGKLELAVLGEGADARVVIGVGGIDRDPLGLGSLDLPQGVEPAFAFHADLARIGALARGFAAQSGMPPEQLQMILNLSGLGGEGDASVTFAWGQADGVGYGASRYRDHAATAAAAGMLERAPIEASEIALVPRDAVSAQITQMDPSFLLTYLKAFAPAEEGDPLERIEAMTGVHLERDLFDHLGTTLGWYTADSTGGGGMFSTVAFVEVDHEDGLRETLAYAMQTLDDLGAVQADGRVAARDWVHGNAACTSLVFPGLPIPLEPSFAIHEGFLLATLTPQALAAAIDHRESGAPGLAQNPRFLASAVGSLDDLAALTFYDNARRIEDGYGLATLLCSALANAVRSPGDAARDPGLVLPPYPELQKGARATVALSRHEGDDLVQLLVGDPSIAANAAALCGSPMIYAIALGAGIGGIMPAMMMQSQFGGSPYSAYSPYGDDVEWGEVQWSEDGWVEDEPSVDEPSEDEMMEALEALGYTGEEPVEEMPEPPVEETPEGSDDPR